MNTPTVRADANIYGFNRDHADSDIGCNIDLPAHNKFRFECVMQYDVMSAVFLVKSNSIGSDNMHPKFIRIILPLILPFITHLFNNIIMSGMYPIKWKHTKIVPVHTNCYLILSFKGSRNDTLYANDEIHRFEQSPF